MIIKPYVRLQSLKKISSRSWCQQKIFHGQTSSLTNYAPTDTDLYTNPVDRLQPFLKVPVIPTSEHGFQPSLDEIHRGADVFETKNYKEDNYRFLGSFPNPHIMPKNDNVPEIAFIGKSNVGKSSLLAALFTQIPKLKVRVSSKPGHTKLMNVFNVNNKFHCIDMPGYGFKMPDHFEYSVEAYLKSRRSIMNFVLFDATVGMTNNDVKYFTKYADLGLPLTIVLTKIDLAKQGALLRNLMAVMKFREKSKANSCFPQPFLVSSVTGEGVAFLQSFIAYLSGQLEVKALSGEAETQ